MGAAGWSDGRWAALLDRIEHRQPDVGLRFWGPPLWLEVTMTGPDSDRWPALADQTASWNWLSDRDCDVADLDPGDDDDRLLDAVARYTVENLILNAVHEIGEWLRVDGVRVFPPHRAGHDTAEGQGNGAVAARVVFTEDRPDPVAPRADGPPADLVAQLSCAIAPTRFTHLPGTTVGYEPAGPVVARWSPGALRDVWRARWSAATLAAAARGSSDLPRLVSRDVHAALVDLEADLICRAFHVDGRRAWALDTEAEARDDAAPHVGWVSIVLDHDGRG